MNKGRVLEITEITIKGIYGVIELKITNFGSGAMADRSS